MLGVVIPAAFAMLAPDCGYGHAVKGPSVHASLLDVDFATETVITDAQSTAPRLVQAPTQRKSETAAWLLSLGGTLVPIGAGLLMGTHEQGKTANAISTSLVITGAVAGPLVGYIYAGEVARGMRSFRSRCLVASGFGLLALAVHSDDSYIDGAILPLFVGSILVAISDIKSIARVDGAVRAHNLAAPRPSCSVSPEYFTVHRAIGFRLRVDL